MDPSPDCGLPPLLAIKEKGEWHESFASRYLRVQVLLDIEEMRLLIEALRPMYFYRTHGLMGANQEGVVHEEFLDAYHYYVASLQAGKLPEEARYRDAFYLSWTKTPEALFKVACPKERQIVKTACPVIQLQKHTFAYSPLDKKFRPMVLGADSLLWGIQFSYPQLFQPAAGGEILDVNDPTFPNTLAFRTLQRWIRHHTLATPFVVDKVRTQVPIRIGKKCRSWIACHPQLPQHGLTIDWPDLPLGDSYA